MEQCGGVQAKACKLLGITPRQLGYKLKKYKIGYKPTFLWFICFRVPKFFEFGYSKPLWKNEYFVFGGLQSYPQFSQREKLEIPKNPWVLWAGGFHPAWIGFTFFFAPFGLYLPTKWIYWPRFSLSFFQNHILSTLKTAGSNSGFNRFFCFYGKAFWRTWRQSLRLMKEEEKAWPRRK